MRLPPRSQQIPRLILTTCLTFWIFVKCARAQILIPNDKTNAAQLFSVAVLPQKTSRSRSHSSPRQGSFIATFVMYLLLLIEWNFVQDFGYPMLEQGRLYATLSELPNTYPSIASNTRCLEQTRTCVGS